MHKVYYSMRKHIPNMRLNITKFSKENLELFNKFVRRAINPLHTVRFIQPKALKRYLFLKLQALLALHHTRKPFHEIQRTRRSHMRVEYDWPSSEASQSDWPASSEMTCFHELPSSGYTQSRRCGQHTFISLYKSSSPTRCLRLRNTKDSSEIA